MKNSCFKLFIVLIPWLISGCGVYSFTGASISPDTKTISILNFSDRSTTSPPFLAQTFAEKTREYFQRNTNLSIVNKDGDLNFEGTIAQYALSPIAPTGTPGGTGVESASQTRLTIGVKVKFTNSKNKILFIAKSSILKKLLVKIWN